MGGILVLIAIGILGVWIIGSILGFVANSRTNKLEAEIKILKSKVAQLQGLQPAQPKKRKTVSTAQTKPVIKAKPEPPETIAPEPVTPAGDTPRQKPEREPAPKSRPAAAMATAPKVKRSFEEEIGARWAVWVGGIALLFGAVFLLRYTIESGFFTPGMRIIMAALFGALLLMAGEWLRRHDDKIVMRTELGQSLAANAYIPGILTAVGIFALLGTDYAAYELYGFISAEMAFVLMAVISLGALALGLLHGPYLSALGLLASLATPLLIKTPNPNAYILFTYLIIVGAVSLVLARIRRWSVMELLTLAGWAVWLFISMDATGSQGTFLAWCAFLAAGFVTGVFLASRELKPSAKLGDLALTHNPVSSGIWSFVAALAILIAIDINGNPVLHASMALGFSAACIGAAFLRPQQCWHLIAAGVIIYFVLPLAVFSDRLTLIFAEILGLAIAGVGFRRVWIASREQKQAVQANWWSVYASLYPILLFYTLWQLMGSIAEPLIWCAIFLVISVANGWQSYHFWRNRNDQPRIAVIPALGATLAYILSVLTWTSGLIEAVGLMAGIIIANGIYERFKMPYLRWITVIMAALTAGFILFWQIPVANSVGPTLIVNALWIYFALPGAICALAAYRFSREQDDIYSEALKAFALVFFALFVTFQIHHIMNEGRLLADKWSFSEIALQVLTGLSFTLGGAYITYKRALTTPESPRPATDKPEPYHHLIPVILSAISYLTLAVFFFVICLFMAPLLAHSVPVKGGALFNSLLLGYLLPAIMLAAIAWFSRSNRSKPYVRIVGGLTLLAALYYLTSIIRFAFIGPGIALSHSIPEGLESYAISASWLVLGILLLILGMRWSRRDLRLASAIVIVLTVLKAFLIDMAVLEGVLRAMSFVILGLVLIVIGRVYQKLLFKSKAAETGPE